MTDSGSGRQVSDDGRGVQKIIAAFGGIRPMASKLGIAVTTVQGWKERNAIPGNRRTEIEDAAGRHGITLDARDLEAIGAEGEESVSDEPKAAGGRPSNAAPPSGGREAASGRSRLLWIGVIVVAVLVGAAYVAREYGLYEGLQTDADNGTSTRVRVPPSAATTYAVRSDLDALAGRVASLENAPPPTVEVPSTDALEQRLADLEKRLASVAADPAGAGTDNERFDRLEAAVQELEARLNEMPAASGEAGSVVDRLDALDQALSEQQGRLAGLEERLAGVARLEESIDAMAGKLSGLEAAAIPAATDLEKVDQRLSATASEVSHLSSEVADLRRRSSADEIGALRQALLTERIRRAISAGAAYDAAFSDLRAALGDRPDLAPALSALAATADGAATRAELLQRLGAVEAETLAAAAASEGDWTSAVVERLQGLVVVRRLDEEPGPDNPASAFAAAREALRLGDLDQAVDLLAPLGPSAGGALGGWLADARAVLAAEAALRDLAAAADGMTADVEPDQSR